MNAPTKFLLALTAVVALSVAYPASVQAVPTTYQYTGNPFTTVSGPYTTSDFVSAMVTLAGRIAPNMPLTTVTPTAFTFSDGVQTLTNLTPSITFLFQFATGPTGAFTQWNVAVNNQTGSVIRTTDVTGFLTRDMGASSPTSVGSNNNSPGTWSRVAGVADTGSTLSLMTLTLMALGLVAQQFKRAAA